MQALACSLNQIGGSSQQESQAALHRWGCGRNLACGSNWLLMRT